MKAKQHILFTLLALLLLSSNAFCANVGFNEIQQNKIFSVSTKNKSNVTEKTKAYADANLTESAFSIQTTRTQPSADNFLKYSPDSIQLGYYLSELNHTKLEDCSSLEFVQRFKHLLIFPFHTFL